MLGSRSGDVYKRQIYARAGVSNDDRSYGMRILGTGSTLTMTNTEDAAQPLSLYVTCLLYTSRCV